MEEVIAATVPETPVMVDTQNTQTTYVNEKKESLLSFLTLTTELTLTLTSDAPSDFSNSLNDIVNRATNTDWWGWGSSLLEKAREKSETFISIAKEDLKEFTKTIETDTKEVIKKLPADTIQTQVKNQISSGISDFLGLKPNTNEKPVIVDRFKSRVLALQTDPNTYLVDPTDPDYATWKEGFQINTQTDTISALLASNDKIREIHTKLVPISASYKDFWERYFFQMHKLNQEEERRAALVKRATTTGEEEEVAWDVEDDEEEAEAEAKEPKKEEVEQYLDNLEDKKQEETKTETTTATTSEEPSKQEEKPKDPVEDDWESWE